MLKVSLPNLATKPGEQIHQYVDFVLQLLPLNLYYISILYINLSIFNLVHPVNGTNKCFY